MNFFNLLHLSDDDKISEALDPKSKGFSVRSSRKGVTWGVSTFLRPYTYFGVAPLERGVTIEDALDMGLDGGIATRASSAVET